jgi:5-methylthioribose kinase
MALSVPPGYRRLDAESLIDYLAGIEGIGEQLGGKPEQWRVREVGDGNLNLVFIVEGSSGGVCVKQALPYLRAAGESWPMPLERAFFEHSYYAAVAPHVGAAIPRIFQYSPTLYCIVMELLDPHVIQRRELIAGRRNDNAARDVAEYVARACFFTSNLAGPFERKSDLMATFAKNQPPVRITIELIFADPYRTNPRNRWTTPQLDDVCADFHRDGPLKAAAAYFGDRFLTHAQALIHGDLHTGSVMVTATDTRVIDPEFAMVGPIGFDLGAYMGNLLLSWYSQPGHISAEDDRKEMQEWILQQVVIFWRTFHDRFRALWKVEASGDAYPSSMFAEPGDAPFFEAAQRAYLESLFSDMIGFGACKMIRRILGFAHNIDFDWIRDPDRRAAAETGALLLARTLLTHPHQFRSISDVVEAAPHFARAPGAAGSRIRL